MPRYSRQAAPRKTLFIHQDLRLTLHYPQDAPGSEIVHGELPERLDAALDWFHDATEPLSEDMVALSEPWIEDGAGVVLTGTELFPLPVPLLDRIENLLIYLRQSSMDTRANALAGELLASLTPLDKTLQERLENR